MDSSSEVLQIQLLPCKGEKHTLQEPYCGTTYYAQSHEDWSDARVYRALAECVVRFIVSGSVISKELKVYKLRV